MIEPRGVVHFSIAVPEARASLTAMAADPIAVSPQEFAALLGRDRERFGALVREADIRID